MAFWCCMTLLFSGEENTQSVDVIISWNFLLFHSFNFVSLGWFQHLSIVCHSCYMKYRIMTKIPLKRIPPITSSVSLLFSWLINIFSISLVEFVVTLVGRAITGINLLLKRVSLIYEVYAYTYWFVHPFAIYAFLTLLTCTGSGFYIWWSCDHYQNTSSLVHQHTFIATQTYMHYNGNIMSAMMYQITSLMIVYSSVYSGTDQRKHQNSASLVFVRGIHRWPVSSPHIGPVTRKMVPLDDVIVDVFTQIHHNPYCHMKYVSVKSPLARIW